MSVLPHRSMTSGATCRRSAATSPGAMPCSSCSWMHASIAGWLTIPHGNGLYVLTCSSHDAPRPSVTLLRSCSADVTGAQPRGPSMPWAPLGEALLRQQGGGVAVLRGAARGAAPCPSSRTARARRRPGFPRGRSPRPSARAVEAEQRADRDRRAEHADAAGAVPARGVVRRVRGVAQPRRGLEAEHERVDEVAARDAVGARVGQQRGRDRRAGVDVVARQRVVEVLDVRRDAVQQRGVQRVRPLRPAEHGRVGRAEHRAERVDRDVDRRVWRATERAPDDVDQRAPSLVHHVGRDVIRPAGGEPAGEVLRRPHGGIGSWGGLQRPPQVSSRVGPVRRPAQRERHGLGLGSGGR